MTGYCQFPGSSKGDSCRVCGFVIPFDLESYLFRECDHCQHKGPAITHNGVEVTVKCNCGGKDRTATQRHPAYACHAPEHRHSSGRAGRCLPTMQQPFDENHQAEAGLYYLCFECELRS